MTAIIDNHSSFWHEARAQRVCAVCAKGGEFHAHHAIPRGFLRRNHVPENDTRNALRLCPTCHMSYTFAGPSRLVIETAQLKSINICFVFDVFGSEADWLLTKHYTGPDERWDAHLRGECPECQL